KPSDRDQFLSAKKSCCFSAKSSIEKSDGHRLSEADSLRLQEILRKNHALDGNVCDAAAAETPAGEIIGQKLEEKIGLHELETLKLLEIQSTAAPKDLLVPDANIELEPAAESGRNKLVDAKTQTMNLLKQHKATLTTPILSQDVECEATIWSLYDSSLDQGVDSRADELNPKFISLEWREQRRSAATDDGWQQKAAPLLCNAAMVIERFLASNLCKNQQAMYFGRPTKIDGVKTHSRFQYELCPLWTYCNASTKNKAVMCMAWNTTNSNILAVGYGQFLASEEKQGGLVCCWMTKNPTQPERSYRFAHSVTALAFSLNSRLLLVALENGQIVLLDVSFVEKRVLAQTSLEDGGHMGPVWVLRSVRWTNGAEAIASAGDDGQLLIWTLNFARLGRLHTRIQISSFAEQVDAASSQLPIHQFYSITDFSISEGEQPMIYLATKEGVLLEVEMELQIQRAVRAHLGPIYKVQVSPFCRQLALTAAADGKVLLWAPSSKNAPILSLTVSAGIDVDAVIGAEWSPAYSTILACASGKFLSIWDLARKTYEPVTKIDVGTMLTSLIFSPDGMNVLVGDRSGQVHVFSLQDMPHKPLMQVEALVKAIPGFVLQDGSK
ncbi:dynein axonemal intermediate chain 4-like, partial [Neocloeon triangulifer]|uniref:dynein axonemal intermediate chain 4-like n=1 Tax=Neocloeon triangulifer TaxID=2078957 RepID=UPI00286F8B35